MISISLPDFAPTDKHGLRFFYDVSTGQLAAMPLTSHEATVEISIEMLKPSAATFLSPISKVAVEAASLSLQHERGPVISLDAASATRAIARLSVQEALQPIHSCQGRIG